jgi:S-adenosylmethionine/arginine decarboxylase-like enzyme
MSTYGKELILDIHDCNVYTFTRNYIEMYLQCLCDLIDMQRCDLHFWDDVGVAEDEQQTSPHTKGTSAVQFILTSNITIHTLDLLGKVFINIFSCKDFNSQQATEFTVRWFKGRLVNRLEVERQ